MRKALQITLVILSLIPLFFGVIGVVFGTGRFLDPMHVVPQLDSQFRYLSGLYLVISFLIWWMVPSIERHGTLMRIIALGLFIGGLARAVSWAMVGPPPVFQMGAMILELSVPMLAFWQSKVARNAER